MMYNKINKGKYMRLETEKNRKKREYFRTASWVIIIFQAAAIFWLLIRLDMDKFTAAVYAILLVVFSVVQLVLVIKSSEY